MRHILVSTRDPEWIESWRDSSPADAAVVSTAGIDETVETVGRSARIDAIVTDSPEVVSAIREEIPGTFPVLLFEEGSPPRWDEVDAATCWRA
ncbi:MAG: hypothetical protein IT186_03695 [Acidobacteria bacterium]|nr:hypothetical protein [Acidobacteriota bacterium]MCG3193093.1 hypothetical protein [Thermoanaerobaculia bacterium]